MLGCKVNVNAPQKQTSGAPPRDGGEVPPPATVFADSVAIPTFSREGLQLYFPVRENGTHNNAPN
jgi:hypothetical protein